MERKSLVLFIALSLILAGQLSLAQTDIGLTPEQEKEAVQQMSPEEKEAYENMKARAAATPKDPKVSDSVRALRKKHGETTKALEDATVE